MNDPLDDPLVKLKSLFSTYRRQNEIKIEHAAADKQWDQALVCAWNNRIWSLAITDIENEMLQQTITKGGKA